MKGLDDSGIQLSTVRASELEPLVSARKVARRNQILACSFATISITTVGTVLGYSAVTVPDLLKPNNDIHATEEEASWFGCLLSGFVADKVGRRGSIIMGSLLCAISWAVIAFAPTLPYLLAGRMLSGLAAGLFDPQVQVYICEVAESWLRGTMGAATGVTCMLGILYVYAMGSIFHWRHVALLSMIFPLFVMVSMCFMPETPAWLTSRSDEHRARSALLWLRGRHSANSEYNSILRRQERDAQHHLSWRLLYKRCLSSSVWKPFMLGFGLMFFQEFAGVYSVTFYQVNIFQEASSAVNEYLATVIVGVVRVGAMLVTCYAMSRMGRRHMLITSGLGMALSTGIMGGFFLVKSYHTVAGYGWLPLACFLTFTVSFCFGFEPLPFTMIPEMMPGDVRSVGTAIGCTSFELLLFVNVKLFHYLLHTIQPYGTFWLYSFMALAGSTFVYFLVPETRGKELEEIETFFLPRKKDAQLETGTEIISVVDKSSPKSLSSRPIVLTLHSG